MTYRFAIFSVSTIFLMSFLSADANAQIFRRYMNRSYAPAVQPTVTYQSEASNALSNPRAKNATRYEPKSFTHSELPKERYFLTKFRHVYQPIKDAATKSGPDGMTLILAEYIGTHRAQPNEEKLDNFQDLQHGMFAQPMVKTASNVKMWKEPFLDGTLRWVPLIKK